SLINPAKNFRRRHRPGNNGFFSRQNAGVGATIVRYEQRSCHVPRADIFAKREVDRITFTHLCATGATRSKRSHCRSGSQASALRTVSAPSPGCLSNSAHDQAQWGISDNCESQKKDSGSARQGETANTVNVRLPESP